MGSMRAAGIASPGKGVRDAAVGLLSGSYMVFPPWKSPARKV